MVIFHRYVSLPEGTHKIVVDEELFKQLVHQQKVFSTRRTLPFCE